MVTGTGSANFGTTTLTVNLTGSAAFTNNTSYQCWVSAAAATSNNDARFTVQYVSGAQFVIRATNDTQTVNYFCIGN